ncbi:TlpA disulfide reductase family protein [Pedobacter sp. SYP-B3415]|uniref:TlpA family protein disulfide reductase n=1 Tax=Pedobacter sp. SYP-B3415 TaxID=2496641 RepID=UPI0013ECC719|nr:TlpA disulfide reductase family protein [Pedobacter sp. SYP-B3415]
MKPVVMGFLCPFFSLRYCLMCLAILLTMRVAAQVPPAQPARAETVKTFKKGDVVPDLSFPGIGPEGRDIKLSALKGKLVILDFWATWCGACLAKIPAMEKLQQQYGDRLAIIMVTDQSKDMTESFLKKLRNGRLPGLLRVANDKVLNSVFKHRELPHYVVIDPAGRYLVETGSDDISQAGIEAMLAGKVADVKVKKDVTAYWNGQLRLFDEGNGGSVPAGGSRMVFSGYIPGLGGHYSVSRMKDTTVSRLTMTNLAIPRLFGFAHGARKVNFDRRRIIFLCKDTSRLNASNPTDEWYRDNMYCYELVVPKAMEAQKFDIAVRDLDRLFPWLHVSRELRDQKCLVLVRTSGVDKIKSKGGKSEVKADLFAYDLTNAPIKRFVNEMDLKYLQGGAQAVLDETNYSGPVDLSLRAKLTDLEAVNKELSRYDLKFELRDKQIDMLVFRDREPNK